MSNELLVVILVPSTVSTVGFRFCGNVKVRAGGKEENQCQMTVSDVCKGSTAYNVGNFIQRGKVIKVQIVIKMCKTVFI